MLKPVSVQHSSYEITKLRTVLPILIRAYRTLRVYILLWT